MVLRDGKIIATSRPEQFKFNAPYQLTEQTSTFGIVTNRFG